MSPAWPLAAVRGPWWRLDCAIPNSILTTLAATPEDASILHKANASHRAIQRSLGTRFATGSGQVTYGALTRTTCRAEIIHHFSRILALHGAPPRSIPFRYTQLSVDGSFVDVRVAHAALHRPSSYVLSQRFARRVALAAQDGIVYRSVRHPGGTCLAIFRETSLRRRILRGAVHFTWNGTTLAFRAKVSHP